MRVFYRIKKGFNTKGTKGTKGHEEKNNNGIERTFTIKEHEETRRKKQKKETKEET